MNELVAEMEEVYGVSAGSGEERRSEDIPDPRGEGAMIGGRTGADRR